MSSICALCGNSSPLQKSHIVPAFIFRWLKDTSGGGYMRFGESPNKRSQDGIKIPLLCRICENLFSNWETQFSKNIFHPYNQDSSIKLQYSAWLARFCTSVSWRVLKYFDQYEPDILGEARTRFSSDMRAASLRWQSFLMNKEKHPGIFEQHILPLDAVQSLNIPNTPNNINRFLMRAVEIDLAYSQDTIMSYAKMGKIIVFGYIKPPTEKWKGTKVSVNHGFFGPREFLLPKTLLDYLFERARKLDSVYSKISEKQQAIIDNHVIANLDRLLESDHLKAMLEDARLFGEQAIIRKK